MANKHNDAQSMTHNHAAHGPNWLPRFVRWVFPKRPETLPEMRKRILSEFSEEFNSGSRERMMDLKRQIDEIDLRIKSSPNVESTREAGSTRLTNENQKT